MGLSNFKSVVVLICEVKATVDGMSLRLPFPVCRAGLQSPNSKKKYVESVRPVSPKMKYLGDFLTKDVATRELEPAKSAYATVEFNRIASYCVRRFHLRFIAGLLLPRTQTSLWKCARKGRREGHNGRDGASPAVCTLPMVPCGSSPVTRFALASAMRKTKRLRRRLGLLSDIRHEVSLFLVKSFPIQWGTISVF